MKQLFALFPYLVAIADEKGISMSEANRISQDNTNKFNPIFNLLQTSSVTQKHVRALVDGKLGEAQLIESGRKFTEEELDKMIMSLAEMGSQNSAIKVAIKLLDQARQSIPTLSVSEIARVFEVETVPSLSMGYPVMKQVVHNNLIDVACDVEKAEELLQKVTSEGMAIIHDDIIEAIKLESKAAHMGKQVANKDGYLRRVANVQQVSSEKETSSGQMLYYTTNSLYGDELAKYDEGLKKKYDDAQKECNKLIARMKNNLRKAHDANLAQYNTEYRDYANAQQEYLKRTQEFNRVIEKHRAELATALAQLKIKV